MPPASVMSIVCAAMRLVSLAALVLIALALEPALRAEGDGMVDLGLVAVNGVQLGSLRSQVVATFGEPRSVRRGRDTELGVGRWEAMDFGGLVIKVTVPEPGMMKSPPPEPYVYSYLVTGSRWMTQAGVRIGNTMKQVIARLGPPAFEQARDGGTLVHYFIRGKDSYAAILLREGRVVSIRVFEDWS